MGQGAGLVYGTERTRLRDGIDGVVAGWLDSGVGPVNGMELGRLVYKGFLPPYLFFSLWALPINYRVSFFSFSTPPLYDSTCSGSDYLSRPNKILVLLKLFLKG